MLVWFKIEGTSPDNVKKALSILKQERRRVVQENGHLYTCISDTHQLWLHRICKDFGLDCSVADTTTLPKKVTWHSPKKEEYSVPCGEVGYDPTWVGSHISNCLVCNPNRKPHGGRVRKARSARIEERIAQEANEALVQVIGSPTKRKYTRRNIVVAKLEPGQSLNLQGVIASLDVVHDQLMSELEKLGDTLKLLKSAQDNTQEVNRLLEEARLRREAAKMVVAQLNRDLR